MSDMNGVEEMLTSALMVGRAIAAITFPGMYRIYDFHSTRAPKLKNASPFQLFSNYDDSDIEDDTNPVDEEALGDMFVVEVGSDKIYLEDPVEINQHNWTPLHTCCMSFMTAQAGIKLVDETVRLGKSLETKTDIGPGTFNKGWTPLHMACAYGVEPLVNKLISAGANVNCENSYGYTPLLEACHRGFVNVVHVLMENGARLDYIPDEELSSKSPFISTPAQSPLAEAARCGFKGIVQNMIDHGAPKNLCNHLGWAAIHEACFYNRIETVKILLLSGADSSIRTKSGSLPYHLAGLQVIRDMIADMGTPGSLPKGDKDVIDMMKILQELTFSAAERRDIDIDDDVKESSHSIEEGTPTISLSNQIKISHHSEDKDIEKKQKQSQKPEMLHTGGILGDLPALTSPTKSPNKYDEYLSASGKKKVTALPKQQDIPADTPKEFICDLCHRIMSDPVRTTYGNTMEKTVIEEWITKNGHICPLTGAPLSESDLIPNKDLKTKIQKWILQKSIDSTGSADSNKNTGQIPSDKKNDDDLYDF